MEPAIPNFSVDDYENALLECHADENGRELTPEKAEKLKNAAKFLAKLSPLILAGIQSIPGVTIPTTVLAVTKVIIDQIGGIDAIL